MGFLTFNQNNSGGSFDFSETAGITHYVIVEAATLADGISRAEDIGIYFNGCSSGRDCSCCGDRWSEPWDDDFTDEPTVYGHKASEYGKDGLSSSWMDDSKEIAVHYADGRIEWFGVHKPVTA